MPILQNVFVTEERRAWMRLRTHTVVFDREPDFARYAADRSGSVVTILRVWVAEASNPTELRHYVGSVRHCECGGWMSGPELRRLLRQATVIGSMLGEDAQVFRGRLSSFLRGYFETEADKGIALGFFDQ